MNGFTQKWPTRFVFGKGAEERTGEEMALLGVKKALIHYGGGSAVRSGLIGRIEQSLDSAGIAHVSLGGAQPNPRDTKVYEGIELIRRENCDAVLAVGGGSAIDSAKAMAHGALYDGDFWDFFSGKAKVERTLKIAVVLTMSAAGSESSNSCVITHTADMLKRGLSTEFNRPLLAIMDPCLAMTLPKYQIASGATDILAHMMERYFTVTEGVDLTDRLLEGAIASVMRAARAAVRDPSDYDAQATLMWGSTIAHNEMLSVGRQGDFGSHQIEHELSALYDCAHGAGLAVVFPAWMRFHMDGHVTRFAQYAVRVHGCLMDFAHPERTALEGIERHEQFLRDIGMPVTLKELGAKAEDIPYLAAKTKKGADGLTGNCWKLTAADIEQILRIADR